MKYCNNCGQKILAKSKFCDNCGQRIITKNKRHSDIVFGTYSMRCKRCDGILTVDADREIMNCPYCGGKELILESDDVKIAKDTNKTRMAMHQMDVELEKKRIDKGREETPLENIVGLIVCGIIILAMMGFFGTQISF